MVNDVLLLLLRASISASLTDREAFIDRVSKIIETHTNKDPEASRNISDNIASAMEGLNEQLLIQQLLRPQKDDELNKKIDRLTETVDKLSATVERLITQNESAKTESK